MESVGTGDDSATEFDLDKAYVIRSTQTISSGTAATISTALTETTDYTIDLSKGQITLTAAGVTSVGTATIFAEYSYFLREVTDQELQQIVNRAQTEVDNLTNNHWATGTDATPDYTQVTNEKHRGKGKFDRDYYPENLPIPDVSTQVNGTAAIGATVVTADSTSGFPDSGTIGIDNEKVTYSSKTSTTFVVTATTAAHNDNSIITPYVIEISTTPAGTAPTWSVLKVDSDYDLDFKSGRIHVYRQNIELAVFNLSSPQKYLPNRFRISYQWGNTPIPDDIKRLTLMLASKELIHQKSSRLLTDGRSIERIEDVNINDAWIDKTVQEYQQDIASNV